MMRTVQASKSAVSAYFDAFAAHDPEPIRPLLAENVILDIPYNPSGTDEPFHVFKGIDEVMEYLQSICTNFSKTDMIDQQQYASEDGAVVFLEGRGRLINAVTGFPYNNRYLFKFVFDDGKISHIDEYANPVTLALTLGLPLGQSGEQVGK